MIAIAFVRFFNNERAKTTYLQLSIRNSYGITGIITLNNNEKNTYFLFFTFIDMP